MYLDKLSKAIKTYAQHNPWARQLLNRIGVRIADKERFLLPFNRCVQEDGFIHIYTDGSCSFIKEQLGLGIVIPDRSDKVKYTFSRRVKPDKNFDLQRFGAMKAEFMAVTHALNQLPDGSNVHIYTDHPILRTVLRRHIGKRKLLWQSQSEEGHHPDVLEMVNGLRTALSSKGTIQVTNLKDTESRRMALAHNLAARGSGAKGIKARKAAKPPPSVENAFLIGDPREDIEEPLGFNDPMPVIDFKP